MAIQPPQGPSDIFRTATMTSAVAMARDREKAHSEMDEQEQDRIQHERFEAEHQEYLRSKDRPGFFKRLRNKLSIG